MITTNTVSMCLLQSLVLISKLPYVTFFHSLLKIMAPEYFEKQEPCLEAGQYDSPSIPAVSL